uniref:Proteolipid protein 2-like n=1 Tax=Sinocyclocheilus anshuiensis TaxID=1608454 RepID=A0A671MQC1_9TELE
MMELDKQFLVVNWLWSDLIRAVIGAALYLITSLICVISGAGDGARIAGGVFGLLAGILFAYDSYTIFLDIKSSRQHTDAPTGCPQIFSGFTVPVLLKGIVHPKMNIC